MKRLLLTFAFLFTISGSVIAGDIPSVDYVPPPPPAAVPGDMGAGGFTEEITDEIVLAIFEFFAG